MSEMTLEQKRILEPFGKIFAQMDGMVRDMTDDDLKAMLAACYATSVTNCWCCTFDAAKHLQKEIRSEMYQREQRAKIAAEPETAD